VTGLYFQCLILVYNLFQIFLTDVAKFQKMIRRGGQGTGLLGEAPMHGQGGGNVGMGIKRMMGGGM